MNKSMLEQLSEVRDDYKIECVSFFNDGSITKDNKGLVRAHSNYNFERSINNIMSVLSGATSSYSRHYDFDTISMNMLFGLVYDANDVDENDIIKENAKPKNDVVRFYTGSVKSYLDGEQTNPYDYKGSLGYQGFINYDKMVKYVETNGLDFEGPQSFIELKNAILSKEPFDINISASFKKEKKLTRKH